MKEIYEKLIGTRYHNIRSGWQGTVKGIDECCRIIIEMDSGETKLFASKIINWSVFTDKELIESVREEMKKYNLRQYLS